jgi:hypothetical protein
MLVLALSLSACNLGQEPEPTPDVGAIFTAAAETVMAEFSVELTQTALAAPTATQTPTNTVTPGFAVVSPGTGSPAVPAPTLGIGTQPALPGTLPTITSAAVLATQGDTCYNAEFIADVTYPDGTVVKSGADISKVWSVKNSGTCVWDDGFSLQPVTGEAMGGKPWEITPTSSSKDFVQPGEIVEIKIDMRVPTSAGEHGGCWRMKGDGGYYFGTYLCVLVMVE